MKLIIPRVCYTYKDNKPIEVDCSSEIDCLSVGGILVAHAAAPGHGKIVWRIQRIDSKGAWGTVEKNSIHVPWDSHDNTC